VRRLLALIAGLPPGGATARAVHGPVAAWDDRTELAAVVCDRLGDVLTLLQSLGGVRSPERLPPIPRPNQPHPSHPEASEAPEPAQPVMSSTGQVREFFGGAARYTPD
jgi:hypothetical protein